MEELVEFSEVEHAAGGDGRVVWAAQGQPDGCLGPGVRAWRLGSAVAVASPELSGRNRLAVQGDVGDAATLVRGVLAAVGTTYRVIGPADLVAGLVERVAEFERFGAFYWLETSSAPPTALRRTDAERPDGERPDAEWLDEPGEKAAGALFDRYFPSSNAQPGRRGVRRWAGVYGDVGGVGQEPVAVAADAWSGTGCGFLAGVVTHPAARGRGLSRTVCGFVMDALLHRYGRVGLMAHADNPAAHAVYERLGMVRERVGATEVSQGRGT